MKNKDLVQNSVHHLYSGSPHHPKSMIHTSPLCVLSFFFGRCFLSTLHTLAPQFFDRHRVVVVVVGTQKKHILALHD
ncbi:hypothetical protein BRADI_2g61065v3 [Brachypodium distachyon]|uniref:Uncharacterized protein n=1 Tax=Brachypodium distachyon TaxID=15368 RepID=A0A0Q3J0W8_BRADI|nr:hypothetical protein BRADI_2g61065v3 [Brachypodium distachyon]